MVSGQTYYIIYVQIDGGEHPKGTLPPGVMLDNWKEAGSFIFNSTTYEQNNINLNVQL